jgi:hypothetical protein
MMYAAMVWLGTKCTFFLPLAKSVGHICGFFTVMLNDSWTWKEWGTSIEPWRGLDQIYHWRELVSTTEYKRHFVELNLVNKRHEPTTTSKTIISIISDFLTAAL